MHRGAVAGAVVRAQPLAGSVHRNKYLVSEALSLEAAAQRRREVGRRDDLVAGQEQVAWRCQSPSIAALSTHKDTTHKDTLA